VFLSIMLFVGAVVGGVASVGGAVAGGAFIEFTPNIAGEVSKAAPGAVFGAILIAVLFLMPSGAAGVMRSVGRRYRRGRAASE
jgi:branched-chain amino acid transport system permease protein